MSASGSTAYAQIASIPSALDIPVYNSSGADIAAFSCVMIDSSHIMESTDTTLNMIGVKVCPATIGQACFGITCEIIPAAKTGRVRGNGSIAVGIADANGVTQGTYVGTSDATAGTLQAATAVHHYVGIALATAASTEQFPVLVCPGTSI